MSLKKNVISIYIVGCIAVALVFSLHNQNNNSSMQIVPKQVNKVFIEVMPEMIEITDKAEIINVIDKLQLDKWDKKTSWDLKYAPNLFIGFKEGGPIITVVYYDGSQIEVHQDNTRDEFAGDNKGINKYIGNEIIEEMHEKKYSEDEVVKYKRYRMESEIDILLLMVKLSEAEGI